MAVDHPAHHSEFRRWSGGVDRRICQTFAASPAEPGELPLGFRTAGDPSHFVSIATVSVASTGAAVSTDAVWGNLDGRCLGRFDRRRLRGLLRVAQET